MTDILPRITKELKTKFEAPPEEAKSPVVKIDIPNTEDSKMYHFTSKQVFNIVIIAFIVVGLIILLVYVFMNKHYTNQTSTNQPTNQQTNQQPTQQCLPPKQQPKKPSREELLKYASERKKAELEKQHEAMIHNEIEQSTAKLEVITEDSAETKTENQGE